MPSRLLLSFLFTFLFLSATTVSAMDFRQGEWEFVVRQSVKGMPAGMGATEWRECLTQAKPMPTMYLQAHSCDVLVSHAVYHTLHYKLSCYTDHGSLMNEGQVHFGNFRMDGKAKSDVGDVAGEQMVVRYQFSGRRVGDCH
jgi:hypothetical protein